MYVKRLKHPLANGIHTTMELTTDLSVHVAGVFSSLNLYSVLFSVTTYREIMCTDVRNSSRCVWDSVEETGKLWDRIKQYIPPVWANRNVLGLNER